MIDMVVYKKRTNSLYSIRDVIFTPSFNPDIMAILSLNIIINYRYTTIDNNTRHKQWYIEYTNKNKKIYPHHNYKAYDISFQTNPKLKGTYVNNLIYEEIEK